MKKRPLLLEYKSQPIYFDGNAPYWMKTAPFKLPKGTTYRFVFTLEGTIPLDSKCRPIKKKKP